MDRFSFLIIAEPPSQLLPHSDTGLAMVREALARGHRVYWALPDALEWSVGDDGHGVEAFCWRVSQCEAGELPRLEPQKESVSLGSFKSVWVRKEPPFDLTYARLCWILSLAEEKTGVPEIINSPSLLLLYQEKLLSFSAVAEGYLDESDVIPTRLSLDIRKIDPDEVGQDLVLKPFDGHGGRSVRLEQKVAQGREVEALTLVQPFLESIRKGGDRRVFFLDGEMMGSFVRVPASGSILSNLSQGGSAEMRPMSPREESRASKLGNFLKAKGLVLAGADMIDEKISEVNITSPTGFGKLLELGGPSLTKLYLDRCEKSV